jgi:transcriptional regulator with XRE-family HTH domain
VDRTELASALRQWRERLAPGDVGLVAGTRRRTPGLRREEVAGLAGVSVDYLTRLEQGRGPHPSDAVLTALARALRLSAPEHEHLVRLAGRSPAGPDHIRDTVRPSVQRLMDRLADLPVLVVNARGDVVAWNAMAVALLGDLSAVPAARRNLLWFRFGSESPQRPTRVVETDGDRLDRAAVSDLRAAAARHPEDTRLRALVDELRRRSERFARLWEARWLDERHADTKTFDHPEVGRLTLDCDALGVPGDDQTVVVYSAAAGTPDAEALALLRVVGAGSLYGS